MSIIALASMASYKPPASKVPVTSVFVDATVVASKNHSGPPTILCSVSSFDKQDIIKRSCRSPSLLNVGSYALDYTEINCEFDNPSTSKAWGQTSPIVNVYTPMSDTVDSGRADLSYGSRIVQETSFADCVFNLANILMGMGILGLPYAFKTAGWIGGSLCLFVFGFITWRTAILIGRELNGDPRPSHYFVDSQFKFPLLPGSDPKARMYPPITSFPEIARFSFGKTCCTILSTLLYFELFSCLIIYFVSLGEHLRELFPSYTSTQLIVVATIVSIIPTIILRTPKLLSYFSMIGTFATITVVMVVVWAAALEGDISDTVSDTEEIATSPTHVYWRPQGLILSLGVVSYCFSGHAIVPSIYSSMRKPQDFEKMVTFTFTLVIFCCFSVAVAGYYMFGNTVADQVTISLKQNSRAGKVMNALAALMVVTAFSKITLTMYPLAVGMEEIISPYLTSEKMVDMCSTTIKCLFTLLAGLLAVFCPSTSFLCALTGMVCTMSVSVIFPAAAHYKMFHQKLSLSEKVLDMCMVVFGCAMAVVGTTITIWE